jgi:hypothetical protein
LGGINETIYFSYKLPSRNFLEVKKQDLIALTFTHIAENYQKHFSFTIPFFNTPSGRSSQEELLMQLLLISKANRFCFPNFAAFNFFQVQN